MQRNCLAQRLFPLGVAGGRQEHHGKLPSPPGSQNSGTEEGYGLKPNKNICVPIQQSYPSSYLPEEGCPGKLSDTSVPSDCDKGPHPRSKVRTAVSPVPPFCRLL